MERIDSYSRWLIVHLDHNVLPLYAIEGYIVIAKEIRNIYDIVEDREKLDEILNTSFNMIVEKYKGRNITYLDNLIMNADDFELYRRLKFEINQA